MLLLDCHDDAAALETLAAAIGVNVAELRHALGEYDRSLFDEPHRSMPKDVLNGFGIDVAKVARRFDGAYFFHATRVADPTVFNRRGILPLDQVVDEIWASLRKLVEDEIDDDGWVAFRRSVEDSHGVETGSWYRRKVGHRANFGPYAFLVRDMIIEHPSYVRDYLGRCPEIVEDISRCYASPEGTSLERRFCETTSPVIVKFRSAEVPPSAVDSALCYAYARLNGDELGHSVNECADVGGVVLPEDVVEVILA